MNGNRELLIVDDDKDILDVTRTYLELEGYTVHTAANGREALELWEKTSVSLVMLDIMMPERDGLDVCRAIREKSGVPILFLSAKAGDADKVIGLRTGADDYVVKPFSLSELSARVEALLRRYHILSASGSGRAAEAASAEGGGLRVGRLSIDPAARGVASEGREIRLTRTEYDLLLLLAENRGRVFTPEQMYVRVRGEEALEGGAAAIMVHIARLREKIGDGDRQTRIIQNVWGVGYKIEKEG
ncbi:response regulator transcription factor [Saccharibacillus alkalitolerans]|uniref:Response regulator transcription factor n=1 Tax=Saccharibacillus alkalitolerans TaxID=2705290 RepID=A0ABX0F6E3_9BACL|nr:response regulator transcription factor [Saccharibacillus alkalitolerans]NGZ76322.1 response regulator transcription factor [Saccharibacillus alkalitolerans]